MQTRDMVVAVFYERDDAEDAINALKDAGFRGEDIGIVARNRTEAGVLAEDTGTEAGAGAAAGALAGGALGGVAGWLVGIGALAIPGIGPIVAAGPLAAALGGAAIGAAGGGLIGALTGAGVPEEEAHWYEERVRSGGWLVTVNARGRYDEVRSILREYGGHDYERGAHTASYPAWGEASGTFRTDYERSCRSGSRWEDAEPAHRFGYESYGRTRDTGTYRDWRTAEPELRREWETRGTGTWDEARSHVRHGYDYGRGRRRFRDYDDSDAAGTAGGAVVGGTAGAVAGGAVAGPPGAVAGAAIGGTAGAAAGNATEDAIEGDGDLPPRRRP